MKIQLWSTIITCSTSSELMTAVSHVALNRVASRLNKLKNPNRHKYLKYLCESILDIIKALEEATEPVMEFLRAEQPDSAGKINALVDRQVDRHRDALTRARDVALFQAANIEPDTVRDVLKLSEDIAKDFAANKEPELRSEAELKYRMLSYLEQQFEAIIENCRQAREQSAELAKLN